MKLHSEVLLEIVDLVRQALVDSTDVSDLLRKIDLVEKDNQLVLSKNYLLENGRNSANL